MAAVAGFFSLTSLPTIKIAERYRLVKEIGCGTFGRVYLAISVTTGKEYAIKVETNDPRAAQLQYERNMYKSLKGEIGFPCISHYGQEGWYNFLVMEKLGPSLEDLFSSCSGRFSLQTVLLLAGQMLARIAYTHSKNIIHRDVKPDNFVIGIGKNAKRIYMIDFGLSKFFQDSSTRQHIPYTENKKLIGTARYASIHAHNGIEQSRRDDLISLGYCMLYFLRGNLPWQGITSVTKKQKYEKIAELKLSIGIEELCKDQPREIRRFVKYCNGLTFEVVPDYYYLKTLIDTLYKRKGCDNYFDWEAQPVKPMSNSSANAGMNDKRDSTIVLTSESENEKAPKKPKGRGRGRVGDKAPLASAKQVKGIKGK